MMLLNPDELSACKPDIPNCGVHMVGLRMDVLSRGGI
jgi:hypothetical protein